MILDFQDTTFKNFFSYGNSPQHLIFEPGINAIFGFDHDKKRSNASGKSSVMETIPFALFGRTNKPVKKEQIINWKNKKNCEVILNFIKDTKNYSILRAIKPDKLEIYENGSLIPLLSDARDYQKFFEKEILGFDFLSFINLIHTNLNNLTPILKLDTGKKRQFLERIFSLEMYSKLVEKGNKYLQINLDKISMNNLSMGQYKSVDVSLGIKGNELLEMINKISSSEDTLKEIENKLKTYDKVSLRREYEEAILERTSYLDKEFECSKSISIYDSQIEEYKNMITNKKEEISLIKEGIKINEKYTTLKKEYDSYESTYPDIDKLILELSNTISLKDTEIKGVMDEYSILKDTINVNEGVLLNLRSDLSIIEASDQCPLCNTAITDDCKDKLFNKINIRMVCSSDLQIKLDVLELLLKENKESLEKINIESKELNRIKIKKIELELELKNYSEDALSYDLERLEREVEKIQFFLLKVEEERLKVDMELQEIKITITETRIDIESFEESLKIINNLEIEKRILLEKVDQETKRKRDLLKLLSDIEDNRSKNNKEIKKLEKDNVSLNLIVDHLNYLKLICKDENIKQYAISSFLPYLNKQVNYYLAESGVNFYLILDAWLNETIEGPGIFNCSYGNLSGGEARSIDLSMQLAFLDISRLQAGIWPDILVLDEILDSSIDSSGLKQMLRIIKGKQRDDSSKIYIVTHRQEIDDMEFNNAYMVNKSQGFSVLSKI